MISPSAEETEKGGGDFFEIEHIVPPSPFQTTKVKHKRKKAINRISKKNEIVRSASLISGTTSHQQKPENGKTGKSSKSSTDEKLLTVDTPVLDLYELRQRIGKGAYGIVWDALEKGTGRRVALKKIYEAFRNNTDSQRTYREIMFLREFGHHPNIISVITAHRSANKMDLYLVFPYMRYDLHKIIQAKSELLTEQNIRWIAYQLLIALNYLHSAEVIHRDLKPANILIDETLQVKLADFGLARTLESCVQPEETFNPILTDYVATRWYRPPEILIASRHYTKGVDMWSFGCILGEMLLKKALFQGESTNAQLTLVLQSIDIPSEEEIEALCLATAKANFTFIKAGVEERGQSLDDIFNNFDCATVDIIERLLRFTPSKRLRVEDALMHPFFACVRQLHAEYKNDKPFRPPLSDAVRLETVDYQQTIYDMIDKNEIASRDGDIHCITNLLPKESPVEFVNPSELQELKISHSIGIGGGDSVEENDIEKIYEQIKIRNSRSLPSPQIGQHVDSFAIVDISRKYNILPPTPVSNFQNQNQEKFETTKLSQSRSCKSFQRKQQDNLSNSNQQNKVHPKNLFPNKETIQSRAQQQIGLKVVKGKNSLSLDSLESVSTDKLLLINRKNNSSEHMNGSYLHQSNDQLCKPPLNDAVRLETFDQQQQTIYDMIDKNKDIACRDGDMRRITNLLSKEPRVGFVNPYELKGIKTSHSIGIGGGDSEEENDIEKIYEQIEIRNSRSLPSQQIGRQVDNFAFVDNSRKYNILPLPRLSNFQNQNQQKFKAAKSSQSSSGKSFQRRQQDNLLNQQSKLHPKNLFSTKETIQSRVQQQIGQKVGKGRGSISQDSLHSVSTDGLILINGKNNSSENMNGSYLQRQTQSSSPLNSQFTFNRFGKLVEPEPVIRPFGGRVYDKKFTGPSFRRTTSRSFSDTDAHHQVHSWKPKSITTAYSRPIADHVGVEKTSYSSYFPNTTSVTTGTFNAKARSKITTASRNGFATTSNNTRNSQSMDYGHTASIQDYFKQPAYFEAPTPSGSSMIRASDLFDLRNNLNRDGKREHKQQQY